MRNARGQDVPRWMHSIASWGVAVAAVLLLLEAKGDPAPGPQTTNNILRYRFRQTAVTELLDSDGRVKESKTEVREVVPVEGRYQFDRLVSRDGKPLTPEQERAEAQRYEQFRQEVRAGRRPKADDASFDFLADGFADLREGVAPEGFEVKKLRTESFKGRDSALLSFSSRAKPSAASTPVAETGSRTERAPGTKERKEFVREFIRSVQGQIWVDEAEREPARMEVRLARPIRMAWCMVSIKKFDLDIDFLRMGPKVWLPAQANVLIKIKVFLLVNHNIRVRLSRDQFVEVTAETAGASAPMAVVR